MESTLSSSSSSIIDLLDFFSLEILIIQNMGVLMPQLLKIFFLESIIEFLLLNLLTMHPKSSESINFIIFYLSPWYRFNVWKLLMLF